VKKYNIYVILPLIVSLFIYVIYRTENTVINDLLIYFIPLEEYREIKSYLIKEFNLHDHIVYSLPEGLWVFCATLVSKDFYFAVYERKINCVFFPLLFSVGLEFLQLTRVTNGTFDSLDIIFAIVFWIVAFHFIESPNAQINILRERKIKSISFILSYSIVFLSDVWI